MIGLYHKILDNFKRRVVYRIFFPFFLIIIAGVSIALPYGVRTTSRIMEIHANTQVLSIARVVSNIIRKDLDKLLTFCELKIYSQPIQDAINKGDIPKLRQLIIPMRARSKVDIVIIFDRHGNEILRFDEHQLLGENLRDLTIVHNGLNGMTYQDIIITPSRLILCAIAPNETVAVRGGMNGAMLVGQLVDDSFVSEIKETTGTDLIISNPEGTVMASTLRGREEFAPHLKLKEVASSLEKGRLTELGTFTVKKVPYRTAHTDFIVHSEPRSIISVILNISGIFQTNRNVTTAMIILMLIGVAMTVFFSLMIAHSISRPIQNLVKATESMAAGDLSQRIEGVSDDEIGRLSGSFNIMVERLSRDIEEIQEARNSAQRYSSELEEINLELKKTQNELIQASKMIALGQLGAGIAHELNQPLLAIGLFAEQTLQHLGKGSQEYKNVEKIISQTDRMSKIINEIRLFARQSPLESNEVDITVPLKKALSLVEKQMIDTNIAVSLRLADNIPPVMADDNQLQQVFLNIITNARDSMTPNGKGELIIDVKATKDRQFIIMDFIDNGIGIAPELLDDIFMPFFTTKKESKGLGLGLFISYGIIKRHMGTTKIKSKPGVGTTFQIVLPTVLANPCWKVINCEYCQLEGNKEVCPVRAKENGYYCWTYFQRRGDDERMKKKCRQCALFQARHSLFYLE